MSLIIDTDDLGSRGVLLDAGMKGCLPRDWASCPIREYGALDMPLIPESEWSGRIRRMEEEGSRLSDIRRRSGPGGGIIPHLDQSRSNYCWSHSATHAAMLMRAVQGLPYVALSAYAIAATIKGGANQGGWGALALDFISQKGVPAQSFWPQGDFSVRKDRPGCWENAALHKAGETWADAAAPIYSRSLSRAQVATLLLCRIPVVVDYGWWGHSVCAIDLVEYAPGQFGPRILNSWADWGDQGEAVLKGSQSWPDGATALRTIAPSEE